MIRIIVDVRIQGFYRDIECLGPRVTWVQDFGFADLRGRSGFRLRGSCWTRKLACLKCVFEL